MIVLNFLSWVLILIGGFFSVVGAIGLMRLPDFYTRSHAVGMGDTGGAGFILTGLMLQCFAQPGPLEANFLVLVKLVAILVFLLVSSPVASHAVVRAAWRADLKPWQKEDAP